MAPRRWPRPSTSPIAPRSTPRSRRPATGSGRATCSAPTSGSCSSVRGNGSRPTANTVNVFLPRLRAADGPRHSVLTSSVAALARVRARARTSRPSSRSPDTATCCVRSSRTTASVSPSCSRRDDDEPPREQSRRATGRARRVGVARRRPRGRDRARGRGVDTVTTPEDAIRDSYATCSWASPTSSRTARSGDPRTPRDRAIASRVARPPRPGVTGCLTSQFGRRRNQRVGPVQWRPRCAGRCAGRGGRSSVG